MKYSWKLPPNPLFVCLLAASLLTIVGCGSGEKPETVALRFAEAVARGDIETAKACTREEDAQQVSLVVSMMSMLPEDKKMTVNFTLKSSEINGDSAKVVFLDEKKEDTDFALVKVNGKWKVKCGN